MSEPWQEELVGAVFKRGGGKYPGFWIVIGITPGGGCICLGVDYDGNIVGATNYQRCGGRKLPKLMSLKYELRVLPPIQTLVTDGRRHLVCLPYSRSNLFLMARQIGLGKHWFHRDHFDIPVNRRVEIESHCLHVSPRSIVRLIRAHHRRQAVFTNLSKSPRKPGITAEKLAQKCNVQWSENMDHEAVLFEYYKQKGAQKLHYCPDWDFMAIHDKSSEFDACTCEFPDD